MIDATNNIDTVDTMNAISVFFEAGGTELPFPTPVFRGFVAEEEAEG